MRVEVGVWDGVRVRVGVRVGVGVRERVGVQVKDAVRDGLKYREAGAVARREREWREIAIVEEEGDPAGHD